jgi:hypothetical protein
MTYLRAVTLVARFAFTHRGISNNVMIAAQAATVIPSGLA